jgi:hypothetical protein
MTGVSSRSGSDSTGQASGDNNIGGGAANPKGWLAAAQIDTTGTLQAVAATKTGIAELALRLHISITVPDGGNAFPFRFIQHLTDGNITGFVSLAIHTQTPPFF